MYRKEVVTETEIDAPPERVWKILTDFASYPQWNPMIRWIEGQPRLGERLRIRFQPEGRRRGQTFRPRLITVDPDRELRWLGFPRLPGFIDVEHYWIVEERPGRKTYLLHGTLVYGLFAVFLQIFSKRFERAITEPFELMNRAHKERAESGEN